MNEHDSIPNDDRKWVPADSWQDYDDPNLLAAAVEAEANYSFYEELT